MTKWLAMLIACLALGLVAVGCGGDDDDDGGGGGAAETTEQPSEPAEDTGGGGGGAKTAEVSMEGIAFEPSESQIAAGGTVTWTNNESVGHDVTKTSGPGPDFSSGDAGGMGEGDTFKQTFADPGDYEYVCTVHPNMTGTVSVK
jgi:plastocyanin